MENRICLNVGCGLSCGKSWKNIDSSPSLRISKIPVLGKVVSKFCNIPTWPQEVIYGDVISGDMAPENSCELIFASHVLEHLSFYDARHVLRNFFRILKPGGTLRIIVPDLEVCVNNYIRRKANHECNAGNSLIEELGMGLNVSRESFLSRLKSAFANSRHQWMYDRSSLILLMEEAGFKEVHLSEYGQWSDSRFAELEEKNRFHNAICFEANK